MTRTRRGPVLRPGWITRQSAAQRLGLSIQRIDQLRRAGALAWERDPQSRAVAISADSVRQYVPQPQHKPRMYRSDTQTPDKG